MAEKMQYTDGLDLPSFRRLYFARVLSAHLGRKATEDEVEGVIMRIKNLYLNCDWIVGQIHIQCADFARDVNEH